MALITLRDVDLRFRGPPLLDGVSCQIEPGQKIDVEWRGKVCWLINRTKPMLDSLATRAGGEIVSGF